MRDEIEIYLPPKSAYQTVLKYEGWRIGLITSADIFTNITYLERHMLTDEAFILLRGKATLLHMNQEGKLSKFEMETGKVYNVPKANWHNVIISEDGVVMVVENADTCRDNAEYMDFDMKQYF